MCSVLTADDAVIERNTHLKFKAKYRSIPRKKLVIFLGLVYNKDKFDGKSCNYTT